MPPRSRASAIKAELEEKTNAQEAQRQRVAIAFLHVFERPESRSADQQIVMEELEKYCFLRRTTLCVANDFSVDPHATWSNEGRRQVALEIARQISFATETHKKR